MMPVIPGPGRARRGLCLPAMVLPAMVLLPLAASARNGPPPPLVETVVIGERILTPSMRIPATVVSRDDALLAMEVEGVIVTVPEVGDRIEKGQLLIAVDDTSYRLGLSEAQAALPPLLSNRDFLQRESKRLAELAEKNNVARNTLEQVQSQYQMASGEVARARVQVEQSRDQLRRTRIHAPFTGVVSVRHKTVGEHVKSGTDILRLISPERTEVQAYTPQHTLPWLRGQTRVQVIDGEQSTEQAVRALLPVADLRSRLYELRIAADGQDWPVGLALRVEVPTAAGRQVLAVPGEALVIRSSGLFVYRINSDNVAERITVRPGISDQGYIEVIADGLAPGEHVVVRGNERLRPGQTVRRMTGEAADMHTGAR